jgi:hypothetical protein
MIAGKRTSPDLSTSEIIALSNEVKDAVSGRKYLERTAIAISGKPYTTDELSGILMHITQLKSVPLSAQTAIRAVAFILDEHASIETANTIAKHILGVISPHIATIQATSEALSTTSISLTNANTRADFTTLKATASRIENVADGVLSSIKDVKNAIEILSPSLDSTQHQLNSIATKITPTLTQNAPTKPTYSSIAATNLSPSIQPCVSL